MSALLRNSHFDRGKELNFDFNVEITRAIKDLWEDETSRRKNRGI